MKARTYPTRDRSTLLLDPEAGYFMYGIAPGTGTTPSDADIDAAQLHRFYVGPRAAAAAAAAQRAPIPSPFQRPRYNGRELITSGGTAAIGTPLPPQFSHPAKRGF